MSVDDVPRRWDGRPDRPSLPDEMWARLGAVHERCDRLRRAVRRRDLTEIVAGCLVVGGFAATWPIYRHSAVARAGAGFLMLWSGLIVAVFVRARRPCAIPSDASIRDFVRRELAWLDGQIRLVGTVPWWYVAPPTAGMVVLSWGLMDGNWPLFGLFIIPALLVAAWVVSVNVRTVRRVLRPARDDVAGVLADLEATAPPP